MNISAIKYDNQAFKATFHKGDTPSTIMPDAVDKDVPDYATVYVSNDGGVPIPYTAAQFRAQQNAQKAIKKINANSVIDEDGSQWTKGEDGYWYKNGEKTDKKWQDETPKNEPTWTLGEDFLWHYNDKDGSQLTKDEDGNRWTKGEDGYWYKNGEKTDNKWQNSDIDNWTKGKDGYWYLNGEKTDNRWKGEDKKD